jgi:hypothetical protein
VTMLLFLFSASIFVYWLIHLVFRVDDWKDQNEDNWLGGED